MKMLSRSQINSTKQPLIIGCKSCVYFLLNDDEIVYVGQSSNNAGERINKHLFEGKEFNSFSTIKVESEYLDLVESFYIHIFNPTLNANYTGSSKKFAPVSTGKIFDLMMLGFEVQKSKESKK